MQETERSSETEENRQRRGGNGGGSVRPDQAQAMIFATDSKSSPAQTVPVCLWCPTSRAYARVSKDPSPPSPLHRRCVGFGAAIWKNDTLGKSGYPGISRYRFCRLG